MFERALQKWVMYFLIKPYYTQLSICQLNTLIWT